MADPVTDPAAADAPPAKSKAKAAADAPASPFVRQKVTNNTDNPVSINTATGQKMLKPGDSGEDLIHENEGADAIDGLVFETL